jgi:hypothetical protein
LKPISLSNQPTLKNLQSLQNFISSVITHVLHKVNSDSEVQDRGSPPLHVNLCNQIAEAEYGKAHGHHDVKDLHYRFTANAQATDSGLMQAV